MSLIASIAKALSSRPCSLVAFVALAILPVHAAVIYQVTFTGPSLNGTNGIINMQFNPGAPTSQDATALVSAFSGATLGAVEPPPPGNGVVTGDLSTAVAFTNTAQLNDFAQNVTFGTPGFQFLLSLDGPAITAPNSGTAGTRFSLLLYEPGFANPLVTADGVIGTLDINPDGSITTAGVDERGFVVQFERVTATIPEPATLSLCAGAFLTLYAVRRVRSRR